MQKLTIFRTLSCFSKPCLCLNRRALASIANNSSRYKHVGNENLVYDFIQKCSIAVTNWSMHLAHVAAQQHLLEPFELIVEASKLTERSSVVARGQVATHLYLQAL